MSTNNKEERTIEKPAPSIGEQPTTPSVGIGSDMDTRYLPPEGLKVLPNVLVNGTTVMALFTPVGKDHYIEYCFFGSWHFKILEIKKETERKGRILNESTGNNTKKPFWELTESDKLKVLKCFDEIGFCKKKEALEIVEPIFNGLTDDDKSHLESHFNQKEAEKASKMTRYEWAEYIENELNIIVDDNGEFYVYEAGVFSVDKKSKKISIFYRDTAKYGFNDGILSSVKNQLGFMKQTDYHLFNPDRNITNFKNGLLNLKTRELMSHTPQYISTTQIPHNYIPNSRSERIDIIISGILKPEDIKALKEFIGYCMTLKINFKIAVMLIGDRHSGKSTIEKIITKLINKLNISIETLQGLSGKFNMFSLKNKMLNMADELPSKTIYDNAPFKTITGGTEFVRGEEKGIQSGTFRQTAKLLFSANKVPESFDKEDEAYLVRWKLISCDNYFDPNDEKTNKNILDDVTEEDYAKFGSECIELFMEVMKTGKFSGEKSEDEKMREYRMASNHVAEFVKILEQDDDNIKKSFMYNDVYLPWCEHCNVKPKSNNKFYEAFKKEGYSEGREKINGISQPAQIHDVKVTKEWDIILKISKTTATQNGEVTINSSEIINKKKLPTCADLKKTNENDQFEKI